MTLAIVLSLSLLIHPAVVWASVATTDKPGTHACGPASCCEPDACRCELQSNDGPEQSSVPATPPARPARVLLSPAALLPPASIAIPETGFSRFRAIPAAAFASPPSIQSLHCIWTT